MHRRALAEFFKPAFEVFEILDVLALTFPPDRPWITDHVGNGVCIPGKVGMIVQTVVQNPVQTIHLVGETTYRITLVAFLVLQAAEMPTLPGFGTLVCHLPEYPLVHIVATTYILRIKTPRFLGDIHHHGARFENAHRFTAPWRFVVQQSRHAVVRADVQKTLFKLITTPDVAGDNLVRQLTFFQQPTVPPKATTPPDEPTTPPEPTPTPDAVNGEKVFLNNQCSVCHSTGTNRVTGPGLAGVLERAATRVEGMSAAEYIDQSIRDPGAFVVDGFPNAMPDGFGVFIPESDIQDLIAYLKTLN